MTLHWHHNERGAVSNHWHFDCLLNNSSNADQRKHKTSASPAFVRGIHRSPVVSPHKALVTRETFPFVYVAWLKGMWHCYNLKLIAVQWRNVATWIWVGVDSDNGLLPDGTKPLSESILTYHPRCLVKFTREQFHKKCSWTWSATYVQR